MDKYYKIIDNFLLKEELQNLNESILGKSFPWYKSTVLVEADDTQFVHLFFHEEKINSTFFPLLGPILNKLKVKTLVKAKVNTLLRTDKIKEHGFHIDFEYDDLKTAVFYCNTNNGYTKLINGDIINSIENRILIFNSKTMHTGTTCTDMAYRTVINFNYYI